MSRQKRIQDIIESRKPMADKVKSADQTLDQIDRHLKDFLDFIPNYAERLDSDAASRVRGVAPGVAEIREMIAEEKRKLGLLSARFTRSTLNIGVVGRAGQGKSTLLQQITGLASSVIPSGAGDHCTGAPSFAVNHDQAETYANIECHTERSFLQEVVAPFYKELCLGPTPQSLAEFEVGLPKLAKEDENDATKAHLHERLEQLHRHVFAYRSLLTGEKLQIKESEIRAHIAQTDSNDHKIWKWPAIKLATIYCRFPKADVGAVGIADTPGLGDFISGAEERLVSTVGKGLDVVLFVRRPPADRQIIEPQDTHLYSLIGSALPDLSLSDWSYFIVNEDAQNAARMGDFLGKLAASHIKTRTVLRVNCCESDNVGRSLDEILNDVAGNLSALDAKLFSARNEGMKSLVSHIAALVEQAENALPKAVAAPDHVFVKREFSKIWTSMKVKLEAAVKEYRQVRNDPNQTYLDKVREIFERLEMLDQIEGPLLPSTEAIEQDVPEKELPDWHANRFHAMRVYLSKAFEELDTFFETDFDHLRSQFASVLTATNGARLSFIGRGGHNGFWLELIKAWEDQEEEEKVRVRNAINRFLSAGLSFRALIQPRVRSSLDVLDSTTDAAADFCYRAGDTALVVREKLRFAWNQACYKCREIIESRAAEVAMARFAIAEDFVDALIREGGPGAAKDRWELFFSSNRNEIWPEKFASLEADTRLRRQWQQAVSSLKTEIQSLN